MLKNIETCSEAEQGITVRMLGQVFMEAWLTALYIHFGGWDAFERVAQNTAYQAGLVDRAIKDFDAKVKRVKKSAPLCLSSGCLRMGPGISITPVPGRLEQAHSSDVLTPHARKCPFPVF